MSIEEIIPSLKLSDSKLLERAQTKAVYALADAYEADLKALIDKLEKKYHLKIGKLIGVGSLALVFEIEQPAKEGEKGVEVFKKSVIRIQGKENTGFVDNPLAIQPLLNISNDELGEDSYYSATIVPRAEMERDGKAASPDEILHTIAAFNAKKQFPRLFDLSEDQFGCIPGIATPVLIDISSMSHDDPEQQKKKIGFGGVDKFIDTLSAKTGKSKDEILSNKEGLDQLVALEMASRRLNSDALQEFRDADINLETPAQKLARQLLDTPLHWTTEDSNGNDVDTYNFKQFLEYVTTADYADANKPGGIIDVSKKAQPSLVEYYELKKHAGDIVALLTRIEKGHSNIGHAEKETLKKGYQLVASIAANYNDVRPFVESIGAVTEKLTGNVNKSAVNDAEEGTLFNSIMVQYSQLLQELHIEVPKARRLGG
jgi:hypothetical protein